MGHCPGLIPGLSETGNILDSEHIQLYGIQIRDYGLGLGWSGFQRTASWGCVESTTTLRFTEQTLGQAGLEPALPPARWWGQRARSMFCKQGHLGFWEWSDFPMVIQLAGIESRLKSNLLNQLLTCGWRLVLRKAGQRCRKWHCASWHLERGWTCLSPLPTPTPHPHVTYMFRESSRLTDYIKDLRWQNQTAMFLFPSSL